MLVIRKEQMEAFEQAMREDFEHRTRKRLRRRFPLETATHDDDSLAAIVHHGIDEAGVRGILLESDASRYLEYAIRYGDGWPKDYEPVIEILENPALSGTQKMDRIDIWEQFKRD